MMSYTQNEEHDTDLQHENDRLIVSALLES